MLEQANSNTGVRAEEIRAKFLDLLSKTNKERPSAEHVKAFSDFLEISLSNCGETLLVPANLQN
jgi:hypothetical protein